MSQITIKGSSGEPVLYGYFFDGDLRFEFEYYGNSKEAMDMEVIYTVKTDDFPKFIEAFNFSKTTTIEEALNLVAKDNLGDFLKAKLLDKSIPNEKFVWMS